MGVLYAMRMASNIGNGTQNRIDNGYVVGDIAASRIACPISVEHRTITITERLQFKEWFQLFADTFAGTRM